MADTASEGKAPATPTRMRATIDQHGRVVASVADPDDPSITRYEWRIAPKGNFAGGSRTVYPWSAWRSTGTARALVVEADDEWGKPWGGGTEGRRTLYPPTWAIPFQASDGWGYILDVRAVNSVGTGGRARTTVNMEPLRIAHYCLSAEYHDRTKYAGWTGVGTLTIGSDTWQDVGGPSVIQVSGMDADGAQSDRPVQIILGAIDPLDRARFLSDPGLVRVTLQIVVSDNGGATWRLVPRAHRGWLANARLVNAGYQFEIAPRAADIDRGRPVEWSDDAQQARHAGDLFFGHRQTFAGGFETRWPP